MGLTYGILSLKTDIRRCNCLESFRLKNSNTNRFYCNVITTRTLSPLRQEEFHQFGKPNQLNSRFSSANTSKEFLHRVALEIISSQDMEFLLLKYAH